MSNQPRRLLWLTPQENFFWDIIWNNVSEVAVEGRKVMRLALSEKKVDALFADTLLTKKVTFDDLRNNFVDFLNRLNHVQVLEQLFSEDRGESAFGIINIYKKEDDFVIMKIEEMNRRTVYQSEDYVEKIQRLQSNGGFVTNARRHLLEKLLITEEEFPSFFTTLRKNGFLVPLEKDDDSENDGSSRAKTFLVPLRGFSQVDMVVSQKKTLQQAATVMNYNRDTVAEIIDSYKNTLITQLKKIESLLVPTMASVEEKKSQVKKAMDDDKYDLGQSLISQLKVQELQSEALASRRARLNNKILAFEIVMAEMQTSAELNESLSATMEEDYQPVAPMSLPSASRLGYRVERKEKKEFAQPLDQNLLAPQSREAIERFVANRATWLSMQKKVLYIIVAIFGTQMFTKKEAIAEFYKYDKSGIDESLVIAYFNNSRHYFNSFLPSAIQGFGHLIDKATKIYQVNEQGIEKFQSMIK